jgi:hypothetical protein
VPIRTGFGDFANETVPYFINATSNHPPGHHTLLLHDLDQNIGSDPDDRVLLPQAFAYCDVETARGVWAPGTCIVPPCPKLAPTGPAFRSIFLDAAVAKRRRQSVKFWPQFQAAGGSLDELVMDTEEVSAYFGMAVDPPPGNPSEMTSAAWARMIGCVSAKWSAIQHDPRFAAVLPKLGAAGFPVPVNRNGEWLSDTLTPYADPNKRNFNNQSGDQARIIWNSVMVTRTSEYWMQAFGESATAAFPHLRYSDFTLFGWSAEWCVPQADQRGWLPCRAGTGSSPALNTHAMDFYNQIDSWRCYDQGKDYKTGQHCPSWGEGIDRVLHDFNGVPYDTFNRTGFNMMKLHLNSARAASLAFPPPTTVLRPWLAFKSFSPRLPDFLTNSGPVHYYQEEVIHAAITGADFFFYWQDWAGYVYGTRALMSDHQLLSDVLHELDSVIGCASRQWVVDEDIMIAPQPASFYLSGVRVGPPQPAPASATIWRFTPLLPVGHPEEDADHALSVLNEMAQAQGNEVTISNVSHDGLICDLHFAQSSLVRVANARTAPYGVWISTTGNATVLLKCGQSVVPWPLNHSRKENQQRLKTDDIVGAPGSQPWAIYYDLGDSARAPATYNISRFGFTTGSCPGVRGVPHDWCFANTWTRDPSAGFASLWPGMLEVDRGGDGLPCTSQKCSKQNGTSSCVFREPCHNFSWTKAQCKGTKIDTGTPFGALCCKAGGCSPQEGNLSEIIAAVGRFVTGYVNESMTGSCALDYESWNNIVTSESFGACKIPGGFTSASASFMRNYSIALVLKRQPELTHNEAAAIASREYSEAATAIMVGALKAAKAARPLCHWGYWGLPCTYPLPCTGTRAAGESGAGEPLCGFDHPEIGPALRAQAQQMQPIVDASDTLYPEIYPPSVGPDEGFKTEHARNRARYLCQYNLTNPHTPAALKPHCRSVSLAMLRAGIRSTIGQAVRSAASVAVRHNRTPMVIPYLWQWCGTAFPCFEANASHYLSRDGIEASLRLPYELGADAEVIWVGGEEASCKNASTGAPAECEAGELLTKVTGPLGEKLIEEATQCSMQHCSGHGRCRPHGCKCFGGYAGPTCSGLSTTSMVKTDDGNTASAPTSAFRFVSTLKVPLANTTRCCPVSNKSAHETRGFHFVLAAGNGSSEVFGCGIDGQLVAVDYATPTHPVLKYVMDGEELVQSRSMLWDSDNRLVVANRDFLFYKRTATTLTLVANVSTAMTGRASRGSDGTLGGDNGINGVITVSDAKGTELLIGAAMPGLLVAAKLGFHPQPFGSCKMKGQPGLTAAFDLDVYRAASHAVPLVVVVSTEYRNLLAIMQLTETSDSGAFVRPEQWKAIGTLNSSILDHTNFTGRGCNRVRVHQKSRRAIFSCFGGGHGHASVGFVDISAPSRPRLMAAVQYVTEQPTGMLVVGDVLFVAGGLEIMVFDMAAKVAADEPPPMLGICGAACAKVGKAKGQNFHSIALCEQAGKYLLFISAQIDNAIGVVEILDPRVITRLKPQLKTDDESTVGTRRISGWTEFSSCGEKTCEKTTKQLAYIIAHKDTIDTVFVSGGGAHPPGMIDGNINHSVCYNNGSGVPIADASQTFSWAAFRFGSERCNLPPLDGDGSGRYLCTPFPDALVTAWAGPLRAAGVDVMPEISGWPGGCNVSGPTPWPVAGRDDGYFAAAVMIAKKFGFAGFALDVEPTVKPYGSGAGYLAQYAQFLKTFSARLAAHGLRLSVAEPNGNLVNTSKVALGNRKQYIMNASKYKDVGHSGAEVATMNTYYGSLPAPYDPASCIQHPDPAVCILSAEIAQWQLVVPNASRLSIGLGAIYAEWGDPNCGPGGGKGVNNTSCLANALMACTAGDVRSISIYTLDAFGCNTSQPGCQIAGAVPPESWWPLLKAWHHGDPSKAIKTDDGGDSSSVGSLRWLTFYNAMNNGARDTHSNLVTNEHIGMLVDWAQALGVRGLLDIHRPGNSSSCGDHCKLFTRGKTPFNFSAAGLQGGGLRPDWKRDLAWTLDQAMPHLRSRAIEGLFLGDEPCCSGAASFDNLSTVTAFVKSRIAGTGAFVYVNECSRVVNPAFHYAGSWQNAPTGLDVISMDGYCLGNLSDPKCPPAGEAEMMKGMYEKWLLPKMASSQRLGVAPGLFGSYSVSIAEQDDALLAKLNGFVAWARAEPRIVLMNPWHYSDLGAPPNQKRVINKNHARDGEYTLGGFAFPKLMARIRLLGDAINSSLSSTHVALKFDDAFAGAAGPDPRQPGIFLSYMNYHFDADYVRLVAAATHVPIWMSVCADHGDDRITNGTAPGIGAYTPICHQKTAEGRAVNHALDALRATGNVGIFHYVHTREIIWPNGTYRECCVCCDSLANVTARVATELQAYPQDSIFIDNVEGTAANYEFYKQVVASTQAPGRRPLILNGATSDARYWTDLSVTLWTLEFLAHTLQPGVRIRTPSPHTHQNCLIVYNCSADNWRTAFEVGLANNYSKFWCNSVDSGDGVPPYLEAMVSWIANLSTPTSVRRLNSDESTITAAGPDPTCAAALDAYCGNASDPAVGPCYKTMHASHRKVPMVAAFSGDIKHPGRIWRCYSPSDLSGPATTPIMQRHFVNIAGNCSAPDCCCTAPKLRRILKECDPSWKPPPSPSPPPSPPDGSVRIFDPGTTTPEGGNWTHFGNAVSLLFIPAVDGSGTLIALTLARGTIDAGPVEVPIIRRSEDGGQSWGPAILPLGKPKPGDRWLPMQQLFDADTRRLLITLGNGTEPIPHELTCESHGLVQLSSNDGGLNWSNHVEDISSQLSTTGETTCLAPTGGVGLQLRKGGSWTGRLLWAMTQNAYQGDVVVYSDDGGVTFNHSDSLHVKGLDEWQMVELANHSILAILRNCANASGSLRSCEMLKSDKQDNAAIGHKVAVALSTDGGVSFARPWLHPDLVTPICNAAIINYNSSLLFLGPYSEHTRENLTVLASDDSGNHFSRRLVLVPGAAGYSSLACGFAAAGGSSADCGALYKARDDVRLKLFRSADIKTDDLPDTVYWDAASLVSARREPRTADMQRAVRAVTVLADKLLNISSYSLSVVNKPMTPPSGTKHDYMSVSSYDWPCSVSCNTSLYADCSHWCMLPETLVDGKCLSLAHAPSCNMTSGTPWVSHDGYGNQAFVAQFDRPRADTVTKAATFLTLAWWYTGQDKYLKQVTAVLREFFLSPQTKMNPNMEYAQGGVLCSDWPTWPSCMKSIRVGHSGGGVVDFARFPYILDAVAMLEFDKSASEFWTAADSAAMHAWVAKLLNWFMDSAMGHSGRLIQSNIGLSWDNIALRMALFTQNSSVSRDLNHDASMRLDHMISPLNATEFPYGANLTQYPPGTFPLEDRRSDSFGYATGDLWDLLNLAKLVAKADVGVDLYHHRSTTGGGSLIDALKWLAPFCTSGGRGWPYPMASKNRGEGFELGVCHIIYQNAANVFGHEWQVVANASRGEANAYITFGLGASDWVELVHLPTLKMDDAAQSPFVVILSN